jgi:hypothetical protein
VASQLQVLEVGILVPIGEDIVEIYSSKAFSVFENDPLLLTNDEGETKLIIERRKHSIIPCETDAQQPLTVCTHLMEDQLIQVGLWIRCWGYIIRS